MPPSDCPPDNRLILLCTEPDRLIPEPLRRQFDCRQPEALAPADTQAAAILFIARQEEEGAVRENHSVLLQRPDCRILLLGAEEELSPLHLLPALLDTVDAQARLLVQSLAAQAELRSLHERTQERFAALEGFAAAHGLATAPMIFSNAPDPANRIYAGPKLREMLRAEKLDYLQVAQGLPIDASTLRCIEIGMRIDGAVTGTHRIILRGAGAREALVSWTLSPDTAPAPRDGLRLAIPAEIELPHDVELLLDLDVTDETAKIECIGATSNADPDSQSRRNGAPCGFPLHMKLFAQTPGTPGAAPLGALTPDDTPQPTRWLLDDSLLRAAECVEPPDPGQYGFDLVGFANGALTIHPVTDARTSARIALPGLRSARLIRAYCRNGHRENDGVEMRLVIPGADGSEALETEWMFLPPDARGVLEIKLPADTPPPPHAQLQSRLPAQARQGNAWAQALGVVIW